MKKLNLYFQSCGNPGLLKWKRTMKLIVLFLLMSAGTLFAEVAAQDMRLNLKVENKSLIEVMDLLKAKSGCSFIFSANDVECVTGITLDVIDRSVSEILSIALKNTGLVYEIEGNLVILKRMPPQVKEKKPRILTGVVLGQDRDTLPGVTVLIKGTSVGVVTDAHGRYKITLPEGDDVSLIFSFIGKQSQTIAYTGQKELNVVLKDDAMEVEEVVVMGYQNVDKRKLTSSVTTLKAENIMMPGVSSIDQMLESHVPGMIFMQNSGQVGATPRLRIRGTSTVLGNQEPLWVVDGIIQTDPVNVDPSKVNDLDFVNLLGNAISGLNPYDIEDINILKDASATALYGTRAANGVIVVTTKKGKAGPLRVGYHVDGTFAKRPRYTDRSMYVMNSRERVNYSREAIEKNMAYGVNVYGWTGYEELVQKYNKGEISFEQFQEGTTRFETMNTDWLGEITRDVFSHRHTLSFSGGAEKFNYYASIGYNRENGVLKKEYGNGYSAILKVNFRENNFGMDFKLSGNVKEQMHTPSDVGLLNYAYGTSRAVPIYDENGDLFYYREKRPGDASPVFFNVLNERDNSYDEVLGNSFALSTNMSYNFLSALKAQVTFSYNVSNTENNVYHGQETGYVYSYAKFFYHPREKDFAPGSTSELPMGGELIKDETKNVTYTLRGQLTYHHFLDAGEQHMLSYDLGCELSSANYTGFKKTFRCYFPEQGLTINGVNKDKWPKYTEWLMTSPDALGKLKDKLSNKLGWFGSITYSYRNTYILNANARLDFSNEFGKNTNDKVLPVWSVSGRWNLKENVLANVNFVNEVALRASFGYQGSIAPEATPELILVKGGMDMTFNEMRATIKHFPNPDLGWEKTASFNTSLDFSLFKNMLRGTVSYFYKKTKNAYLTKKVPRVNGVSQYMVNQGTVENQGFEFSFNIIPVNTMVNKLSDLTSTKGERRGFRWSIDPQLGQVVNKLMNKVTSKSQFNTVHDEFTWKDYLNGNAYVTGRPLNSFFSYEFTGLSGVDGRPTFARVEEDMFDQYSKMTKAGVFTTVMKYSGCRVPYLQGGVSNTFEYANFILSFNLAYSVGSKIRLLRLYDKISAQNALPAPIKNMRREFVNRWKKPGDELHTNIPGLLNSAEYVQTFKPWWYGEPFNFADNIWQMYDNSNVRVVSGNYIKLQSINLRYLVPQDLCKKLRVSSMYLSLSGTNLFTWCDKDLKGQEPTQSGSADNINVGVRPTYSLSLDVLF